MLERLYINEGLSIKKIADAVNETYWRVRQNLISHNIQIRPVTDHESSKILETQLNRLFLREKLTVKEIAARLGCSPKTINKKLRKFGIRSRL